MWAANRVWGKQNGGVCPKKKKTLVVNGGSRCAAGCIGEVNREDRSRLGMTAGDDGGKSQVLDFCRFLPPSSRSFVEGWEGRGKACSSPSPLIHKFTSCGIYQRPHELWRTVWLILCHCRIHLRSDKNEFPAYSRSQRHLSKDQRSLKWAVSHCHRPRVLIHYLGSNWTPPSFFFFFFPPRKYENSFISERLQHDEWRGNRRGGNSGRAWTERASDNSIMKRETEANKSGWTLQCAALIVFTATQGLEKSGEKYKTKMV